MDDTYQLMTEETKAIFGNAAFWVILTFVTIIVWVLLQRHFATQANKKMLERISQLEKNHAALSRKVTEMDATITNSPFPWLKKVKS
jgi:hypothetical protein